MTTVDTGTALLILVAFLLPGFVAVLVKERIYEVRGEESGYDRLLTIAYYSVLVWATPAIVAIATGVDRDELEQFLSGESALWLTGVVALAVLLVLPVGAAYVAWRWVDSERRPKALARLGVRRVHRFASSWDWAFDSEQDLLLVVTLRDGARIAGYYGERSHSGYGSKVRDLFLEERWEFSPDGAELVAPAPGNVGVWIGADDIVAVEQYALTNGQRREILERAAA